MPTAWAARLVDEQGRGDAYLASYVANGRAVTPDQVRQTTVRYLDPARMSVVVVGDHKVIDAQVEPYRPKTP